MKRIKFSEWFNDLDSHALYRLAQAVLTRERIDLSEKFPGSWFIRTGDRGFAISDQEYELMKAVGELEFVKELKLDGETVFRTSDVCGLGSFVKADDNQPWHIVLSPNATEVAGMLLEFAEMRILLDQDEEAST